VFLAASAALVCATAIGVALGGVLFKYIPEAAIRWVAGTAFIAVGLWVLVKG
jgi:putative Ca2+/H+ antiporter (TMEM165/GDT1 family)